MDIKNIVLKKDYIPKEPKYNINQIYCVFASKNSEIFFFVFNKDKTKIKDISNPDNIIDIHSEENNFGTIDALSSLFNIDASKINYAPLTEVIKHHTYGIAIPGKVFTDVRKEIWSNIDRRNDALEFGSFHKLKVTASELNPLKKQLAQNLEYTSTQLIDGVFSSNEEKFYL